VISRSGEQLINRFAGAELEVVDVSYCNLSARYGRAGVNCWDLGVKTWISGKDYCTSGKP
jgi:hypothetical protein